LIECACGSFCRDGSTLEPVCCQHVPARRVDDEVARARPAGRLVVQGGQVSGLRVDREPAHRAALPAAGRGDLVDRVERPPVRRDREERRVLRLRRESQSAGHAGRLVELEAVDPLTLAVRVGAHEDGRPSRLRVALLGPREGRGDEADGQGQPADRDVQKGRGRHRSPGKRGPGVVSRGRAAPSWLRTTAASSPRIAGPVMPPGTRVENPVGPGTARFLPRL
jgi:hypothetical protein